MAVDCSRVVPGTLISQTKAVTITSSSHGPHKLCYRAAIGSDGVVQTNVRVIVVEVAPAAKVSWVVVPANVSNGVAIAVTSIGIVIGDKFDWTTFNGIAISQGEYKMHPCPQAFKTIA